MFELDSRSKQLILVRLSHTRYFPLFLKNVIDDIDGIISLISAVVSVVVIKIFFSPIMSFSEISLNPALDVNRNFFHKINVDVRLGTKNLDVETSCLLYRTFDTTRLFTCLC